MGIAALLTGQTTGQQAGPVEPGATQIWTPPRTPWGDPDLQGHLTNSLAMLQDAGWRFEPLVWQGQPVGIIVDLPEGTIPPLTPRGQADLAARAAARAATIGPADSHEDRNFYDRCISRGLPGSMMPIVSGNSYQILQAPGYVAIRYEVVRETRIIPLDGRRRLDPSVRRWMGDARGRWDGDTLVVETTNVQEDIAYRGARPETLRIIERFTRVSPDTIQWAVTIDDPQTWTRPWTFQIPLTFDDDEAIVEYACHEGNYALWNILRGHRIAEQAAPAAANEDGTR